MTCSNCLSTDTYARGLCHACYTYLRRTGLPRPLREKLVKTNACAHCGSTQSSKFVAGLCMACYKSRWKHGSIRRPPQRIVLLAWELLELYREEPHLRRIDPFVLAAIEDAGGTFNFITGEVELPTCAVPAVGVVDSATGTVHWHRAKGAAQ